MIIQNITQVSQAAQLDARANGAEPVRAEPKNAVADTPQVAPVQPTIEELQNAVAVINKVMQSSNHSLQFSVDSDAGRVVVKMVDTSTGELIRQFPSEETLAISRGIDKFQQGLLVRQEA
jgi:flagellar protein FlaG